MAVSSITDLPLDILVLVFPYLDARSFLALCSTCKAFQQNSIRLDPSYWSHATRSTFRVPNQPVVQHDGDRWQKLYKRLLTQSRVFTWGSNTHHRLGHSYEQREAARLGPRPLIRRRVPQTTHCSFPTEMEGVKDLGIIADMQCGGWSTTILTSQGSLYSVGVLDGQQAGFNYNTERGPQTLRFPNGYPYSTAIAAYEEPTITIRQFSSGRSHILGLSDSGRIWSWYAISKPALHIKFLDVDITEASSGESSARDRPLFGRVKKVVAGWSRSSAYIYGTGIVVWDPVKRRQQDNDEVDTMLIMENSEIPKTGYQRVKGATRETDEEKALGEEVGAVINYVILENYVVFVTDIGKVFTGKFGEKNQVEDVLELCDLRGASDVQGSFRRFAIFKNGEVITTSQDYLDSCWNVRHQEHNQNEIEGLKKIPALQQNDVISVAFGDYHFLALHSTGKITSYGTELQACGALGLGGDGDPEGRTRGIRYQGFSHDGKLLPHAYTHGREVWFEAEKKKWITFSKHNPFVWKLAIFCFLFENRIPFHYPRLHVHEYMLIVPVVTSGGKDPDEAKERMRMFVTDQSVQGEVSEWFEQQGRDWDREADIRDEDGLGSHFALSISAAGWHSGAVVLVNQAVANQVRDKCIIEVSEASTSGEEQAEGSGSWDLASWSSWIADMGRNFLGLPSADEQEEHRHDPMRSNHLDPVAHGAIPYQGARYTWADKSFPRLRLSDGREMPGTVDFDTWKLGRPDWQLDVEV